MKLISDFNLTKDNKTKKLWLSLGNFDGVHIAHQKILRDTVKKAEKYDFTPGILLLEPHPEIKFHNKSNFLLTTLEEKINKISSLGIQVGVLKEFDREFAELSPREYSKWLCDKLRVQGVSVGFDYSFGQKGMGSPSDLQDFGKQLGFEVSVIEPIKIDGAIIVSSQLCRKYIREGHINKANQMLSSPYTISGTVTKGAGRGANLGFPTANIKIPKHKIIPRLGVYLVRVEVNQNKYWGVCNVGNKPTFSGEELMAETFLLDNKQDLYNEELTVSFLDFIRDERKFLDSNTLVSQVNRDIKMARDIIANLESKGNYQ
ncbi:bifunctional riboflavin kinase/FAD synthetase [Natranaerobius thermophilus]|uniref:Riboflavin biosynthesis protein n=1 Tax=Natranaerobius thermophilus (strain ATCC BAA-1301 / DSM 18059 / JW/NM-WN-LF) TaxID=457570 RepID=B2A3A1_NATTJ|nr:bifunctional riboflavin kinase/FAD synthetase [Natranaerobius thermophilus]ACB85031.1 riboflavin biosynthesis protein RibF [Natranaerobius thermophilus JW/NM-WN-LF]